MNRPGDPPDPVPPHAPDERPTPGRRYVPETAREIPAAPGCYLMRDAADGILYVGKAVNLRSRVSSYFRGAVDSPKTRALVARVASIEVILTRHEPEALILENSLIKRHRPRYNINLKDDKTYPFLMLTVKEEFPRCVRTRTVRRDGSLYFGPYPDARAASDIARTVEEAFGLCRRSPSARAGTRRSCLVFDMGLCAGACLGRETAEDYRARVDAARRALRGSIDGIVALAEGKMRKAAEAFDFEAAALWRDRAASLRKAGTRQTVVDLSGREYDACAVALGSETAAVTLFMVRDGKLAAERTEAIDRPGAAAEILEEFLSAWYGAGATYIPARIVVPEMPANAGIIAQYLKGRRGHEVEIALPGPKERELLSLAAKNANYALLAREREAPALDELKEMLGLRARPERIECYDISNISGTLAVGARVVFAGGRPENRDYRRYRIRTVEGPDDYAMMREMLSRRFRRVADGEEPAPDLVLVDGGPGHLGCATEVLASLSLDLECASLAKRDEEVFRPGVGVPLRLPRRSAALKLLQRLRDEAHRFAIGYHRALRGKGLTTSLLQAIPGVGPKRVRALFDHFGSLERIRDATPEELALCPGIPAALAAAIRAHFRAANPGDRADAEPA